MPRPTSELADLFAKALEEIDYDGIEKTAYPFIPEWTEEGRSSSYVAMKDTDPVYNLHHADQGYDIDENIVDLAHPETVIIHPSYDKINGVFENINERSKIMRNLALDKPVGLLALNKYASQELTMELIRVANEMDAADQEDLFVLADTCLLQMKKEADFKKEALVPLLIGIAAAALGAVWLANNTSGSSKGLLNDCNLALKAIGEVKKQGILEGKIDEMLSAEMDTAATKIEDFKVVAEEYYKVLDEANLPRTEEGAKKYLAELKTRTSPESDPIKKAYDTFKASVKDLSTFIAKVSSNLNDSDFVSQHKETTWLEENTGFLSDLVSGNKGFLSNDFAKAARRLETLNKSMAELAGNVQSSEKVAASVAENLKKTEEAMAPKPKSDSPAPSSSSTQKQEYARTKDNDDELSSAMKS